jgi:hypothetical protein
MEGSSVLDWLALVLSLEEGESDVVSVLLPLELPVGVLLGLGLPLSLLLIPPLLLELALLLSLALPEAEALSVEEVADMLGLELSLSLLELLMLTLPLKENEALVDGVGVTLSLILLDAESVLLGERETVVLELPLPLGEMGGDSVVDSLALAL